MAKLLVSVFNDKGNFAGNLDVVDGIDLEAITRILQPHSVTSSTVDTVVVRPMRGISINEEGFLSLIKAQLISAEVLEDAGRLETGFGKLKLEASFTPDETGDQFTAQLVITEEGTGKVLLANHYEPVPVSSKRDFTDWVIGRLVEDAQGFQSLISQGTEYLVGRIQEFAGPAEPEPEHQAAIEAPAKAEAARPARVRVDQAPQLQRPAEKPNKVLPSKVEIGKMLKEAQTGGEERFAVNIPIQVLGREPQSVVIEVDRTNFERISDEGVLTTIVNLLPEATIQNDLIVIGESKGYLLKIRQAFNDHGIDTISVTPRAGGAFTDDGSDGAGPISIFNI
jgi:hypothetical protein